MRGVRGDIGYQITRSASCCTWYAIHHNLHDHGINETRWYKLFINCVEVCGMVSRPGNWHTWRSDTCWKSLRLCLQQKNMSPIGSAAITGMFHLRPPARETKKIHAIWIRTWKKKRVISVKFWSHNPKIQFLSSLCTYGLRIPMVHCRLWV